MIGRRRRHAANGRGPDDTTLGQISHAIGHEYAAGHYVAVWLHCAPTDVHLTRAADEQLCLAIEALTWAREALAREVAAVAAARRFTQQ